MAIKIAVASSILSLLTLAIGGLLSHQGIQTTIGIASVFAFLVSFMIAFLVNRFLSLPLRILSQAAKEIGEGSLTAKLEISNQDELGDLARALQTMHNKTCANREKLENYSRNLEQTVAWRTSELRETKETISAMIDSLDEGFFMFGRDGFCLPYFSHACIDLLEQEPAGKAVESLLKLEAGSLKVWLEMAFSDQIPFDGIADLAPKSCKHSGGKHIKISFHLIRDQNGKISYIVGVAQNITAMILAEKAAEHEREFSKLVIAIIENRDRFSDFILESEAELSNALNNIQADIRANILTISPESLTSVMRALHTLKGCAGLFYLTEIHRHAHDAESELTNNKSETPEELARLLLKIRTVLVDNVNKYAKFIGFNPLSSDRLISVREKDILTLRESLRAMSSSNLPNEFLLPAFDRFFLHQNIDQAFSHYNLVVKQAAEKLDKNVSDVQFINGDLKLYLGPFRTLFGTCIHAFRNAVDHGLETPEERLKAGKAEAGSIIVVFGRTAEFGDLSIEIRDDGRGIDEEIVRNKLRKSKPEHPLVRAKYDALIQVLFESGFSTKTKVTEISGRGVGLDTIRFEAQRLGGTAWISSALGQGSIIHIRVPLSMDRRSQKLAA
jgi:two-component system chemotaxis sensor kinase CheA